jgi:Tfp pilus assembly protein PilF
LALKDLTKAIELDKNFYQAYYNRGSLYKCIGNDKLAQKDFVKAEKLAKVELENNNTQRQQ